MTAFVTLSQVCVSYAHTEILHNVNFDIKTGEIVICIGPNGAGKSTLLRAITGVIPLHSGQICVNGKSIATLTPAARAKTIAVVPQHVHMPIGFTVYDVVAMARYVHQPWYVTLSALDHAIIMDALALAGVAEFAQTPATNLSGGEQQRVAFARAIAQQPRLLILDESTAHLDLQHQRLIIQTMRQLAASGVTIIAAMHDINLAAQAAERICLLDAGHVVALGTPSDVLHPARLAQVYRTPIDVIPHHSQATPFFHISFSE